MAADDDQVKGGDETKGGARQRPTVTIDLAAEDVRAKAAGEPPKDERPAEPRSGRRSDPPPPNATPSSAARAISGDEGWRQAGLAGLAGAIIALVVVALLQAIGIWPAPGRGAANQALEQSKATADTATALERRIAAIESMTESLPAMRTDLKAIGDKVDSLNAIRNMTASRGDLDALSAGIAALGKRIDALPPPDVTKDDLAALTERVARLEVSTAGGAGVAPEAVSALGAQLADSEAQLKALSDRVAAAEAKASAAPVVTGGGEAATRGLAVAALRRAAQGSTPFADDVDMVAGLGLAGDDIAALRPYAAKGVADAASLAAEFPAVADAILSASAASDPNVGFWQRLFGSVVSIRPAGPVAGSDPAAIVSRMKDDVARGDLAAALAERDALPAAGKDASAAWAATADDRVALDALIDKVARTLDPKAG
ncbi:MAG: hypothetical protein WDM94_01375 [Bauldia sp.]